MNFSLLGFDDAILGLARAVCSGTDHQITAIYAEDDRCQQLREIAPAAQYGVHWELLLDDGHAGAVLVAADDSSELRNDVLRKIVQAGKPLLLVHPACDAMVGYELEMIRSESAGMLFPYVPGQRHVLFQAATQLFENPGDSPIGALEQVVVEHFVDERNAHTVLASLTSDTGLLVPMVGRVEDVMAFGPDPGDANYSTLCVNMVGSKNVPVRWSVASVESAGGRVVTLVGARGRAVLSMLGEQSNWSLEGVDSPELPASGTPASGTPASDDADAAAALADFQACITGQRPAPLLTWTDACRASEVSTAARESLRRGRKIKLYDDQYSEQQTFKGKMAAAGCLLLMLVMLVMFGFALFDGVMTPFRDKQAGSDDPSEPTASLWLRLWPAYPLLAFLLLQLLKLVFVGQRRREAKSGS